MYAQQLQWNYFDHPPMVGWLIRLTTVNLWLDNELFIRLGAISSAAITTWLLYLCGKKINTAYTGFLTALLYTATVYGSIIAGTFILPDSPQMICWSAGLYLLLGITEYTHINQTKKRKLILFGIVAGLGMLCKIHTAFLWVGFLLYIFFYNRAWLKEPRLYLSGLISLGFFYPVILWNIDHHFVTYLYHGKRVNIADAGLNISTFAAFTAGQVLYTNPLLDPYLVIAVVAACKNRLPMLASQKRVLLFCSLPLLGVALVVSFFKEVLPLGINLLAIGDTNNIHQYVWFNKMRRSIKLGDDAYAIVPSNNYIDVTLVYGRYFTSFEPMPDIEQYRNGAICRRFYLWRLKSYKGMRKTDKVRFIKD
jgi:4-amino-4-deoxy-L-arabinose transferase-like glycosyltransferase